MGKTLVVNGKTYSERTIDNIVVDGQIIKGNSIPKQSNKEGEMVNLDINIKSFQDNRTFEASSNESAEAGSLSLDNNDVKDIEEKETLKNKLIKEIIKFLNKFIAS